MRTLLTVAAIAVVASAVPVSAEVVPTAPCEVPADTTVLGLTATSQAFAPSPIPAAGTDFDDLARNSDVPAPVVPYHEQSAVSFDYIVDVSGSSTVPAATKGNATLNLGWDNDSDFDMYVYDAAGNDIPVPNGFNPLSGAGESVTLTGVAHCTVLHVEVVNYAGLPTSAMTLGTTLKGLK
jgi:hypothetical protein